MAQLFLSVVNSNNLLALVITASLANTVCKNRLAALGAFYYVRRLFELPNS